MTRSSIHLHVGENPEVEALLAERLYVYNAKATGNFDGESFSAADRDDSGAIRAGVSGYTWGGCCFITYLWVAEGHRGHGLGSALLLTAEEHANTKNCEVVLVSSHNFQAPDFYAHRGYKQQAVVQDHPVGHSNIFFSKRVRDGEPH